MRRYVRDMSSVADLYEHDSYAWALDQAEKLRAWPQHLRPNGIDIENIAEEIESLGRSDARAMESLFEQLFLHLLKLRHVPDQTPGGHWRKETTAFRKQLRRFAAARRGSPKLWSERHGIAADAWRSAADTFCREARIDGLPPPALPETLPFDLDRQALDLDWYPDPPAD
jgi:hypothetical protein